MTEDTQKEEQPIEVVTDLSEPAPLKITVTKKPDNSIYDMETHNIDQSSFDFDKMLSSGAMRITYAGDGKGGYNKSENPESFSVVTPMNPQGKDWPDKPGAYETAKKLFSQGWLDDGKYSQIIDSHQQIEENQQSPFERAAQRVRAGVTNPPDRSNLPKLVQSGGMFSPAKMVESAVETVKDTGKLYEGLQQGTIEPSDMAAVSTMFNAAGLVAGGGVATAPMRETGLGVFGGIMAKTANRKQLEIAQNMEHFNAGVQEIFDKTGWFRGADGRWRFEIPDEGLRMKVENLEVRKNMLDSLFNEQFKNVPGAALKELKYKDTSPFRLDKNGDILFTKLEDIIEHPELFRAYPHLKDVEVADMGPWDAKGWFDEFTNKIALRGDTEANMRNVVAHEIQHAVQAKEGFARGGSPQEFIKNYDQFAVRRETWQRNILEFDNVARALHIPEEIAQEAQFAIHEYVRGRPDMIPQNTRNALKELKEKWPEIYDYFTELAHDGRAIEATLNTARKIYTHLAGEAEARVVQERLDMPAWHRKAVDPRYPADIGLEPQILAFKLDNGLAGDIRPAPIDQAIIGQKLFGKKSDIYEFKVGDETGSIVIKEMNEGKTLHVSWVGKGKLSTRELDMVMDMATGPWSIGTKEVMAMLREVRKLYPRAEKIEGFRVSGARKKAEDISVKLPKD